MINAFFIWYFWYCVNRYRHHWCTLSQLCGSNPVAVLWKCFLPHRGISIHTYSVSTFRFKMYNFKNSISRFWITVTSVRWYTVVFAHCYRLAKTFSDTYRFQNHTISSSRYRNYSWSSQLREIKILLASISNWNHVEICSQTNEFSYLHQCLRREDHHHWT